MSVHASRSSEPSGERDDLDHVLIMHTYELMPYEGVGAAFVSASMTCAIVWLEGGIGYWIWSILQLVALVTNIGVYGSYRTGRFEGSTRRMRWARRLGVLATGLAWGAGGLFWPMTDELGLGFAIVFCCAGLSAGSSATLAGDPLAYAIFVGTTLLPWSVSAFPELWWVSVMMLVYVLGMSAAAATNHRMLAESMRLRFENKDLLRSTIAEREAAISARADAERAAESKTRFLAAASHDLRQPVQALSLFVDVLTRDGAPEGEERARALSALSRTTDAMRAMLEAMLDISRLDAGLVAASPRAVPLEPLLAEIVAALRDEAESYDMVVHAAGRMATVLADEVLLARVLHNLAANAVRHARRGRVLLAVRHKPEGIVVQVWDQGPGVAPADRSRIFDEYVQLENPERDRRKGLGLGLPIVRRICALSGFRLEMQSRVGHGTTFSVTLPRAASGESPSHPPRRRHEGVRVLLVEDDVLVCEAAVASLAGDGCTVHVAHDVQSARAATNEETYDVLVTDHRLPGDEDGADLVRGLTRDGVRMPTVMLTGDMDVPLFEASDLVILRKPVSGDALFAAIDRVLAAQGG